MRLLNRTTRSVTPTAAGERLLAQLEPALGEVAAALGALDNFRDRPAGTLRLNVPTVAARLFLPDIACRFLKLYPEIELEIVAEDTFIDVLAAGFDAGIRYDERIERDMIAVPIGPSRQRYVTAASPAYLQERGMPQHPRDLLEHSCSRHRFLSGIGLTWEFERGGETFAISPSGALTSNSIEIELAAAVAGLGIISSFQELLESGLASGQLVAILDDWASEFSGPYLYYASRRHMPAPLRAFVDFLKLERQRAPLG